MTDAPDAVVIFARAPELGRVKTRLAAELGPERALAIYRGLADQVVAAVRDSAWRRVIAHAPADAGPAMRAWLGDDVSYEPQCAGDLGRRLSGAIAARLAAGAERVVVIGTDCPTITARTVGEAFAALDTADVVFGPATDGGYYLVGMRQLHESLFRDIPWSCDRTLHVSLEHAAMVGLRVALLATMRDIDTAEDWRAHGASAAAACRIP